MIKIVWDKFVYTARSNVWYSDVLTVNPAYRWCVGGVVYWLEQLQPDGCWVYIYMINARKIERFKISKLYSRLTWETYY